MAWLSCPSVNLMWSFACICVRVAKWLPNRDYMILLVVVLYFSHTTIFISFFFIAFIIFCCSTATIKICLRKKKFENWGNVIGPIWHLRIFFDIASIYLLSGSFIPFLIWWLQLAFLLSNSCSIDQFALQHITERPGEYITSNAHQSLHFDLYYEPSYRRRHYMLCHAS